MSEPDTTAPQAGGGKGTADEESALRWQAADELLTALAVSPTAHRNLEAYSEGGFEYVE